MLQAGVTACAEDYQVVCALLELGDQRGGGFPDRRRWASNSPPADLCRSRSCSISVSEFRAPTRRASGACLRSRCSRRWARTKADPRHGRHRPWRRTAWPGTARSRGRGQRPRIVDGDQDAADLGRLLHRIPVLASCSAVFEPPRQLARNRRGSRTVITGQAAVRTTPSATLPARERARPVRPWVPSTTALKPPSASATIRSRASPDSMRCVSGNAGRARHARHEALELGGARVICLLQRRGRAAHEKDLDASAAGRGQRARKLERAPRARRQIDWGQDALDRAVRHRCLPLFGGRLPTK